MSELTRELVVVGAGISGLGLAHMAVRKGVRPLVLEGSDDVGGCIRSHYFSGDDKGFWAELGAHTCFNSYGNLLSMLDDLGAIDDLKAKEKLHYKLLSGEVLHSIPSQLGLFELARSLPRLLTLKKGGHTAEEYFGGLIGRNNFRKVLGPALDAVICQPAGPFPADALFRKKPRRKEVMRSFTTSSGIQYFPRLIAAQEGIELKTGSAAVSVERREEGFLVRTADGAEWPARRVALAVAPDVAARLLASPLPNAADLAGTVGMAEIETVSVQVAAEHLGDLPPLAGIIAVDDDFYSAVSRDPIPDSSFRGFTFHFRPGRLDAEGKLARIRSVLKLGEGGMEAVTTRDNRLPQLRVGHERLVRDLDGILATEPLAVTGNWFAGVSMEDSLTRSAEECARLFPA